MKSPVASLCLVCSSVRKRVNVTMSVLIFSSVTEVTLPFVAAIVAGPSCRRLSLGRNGGLGVFCYFSSNQGKD